MKKICMLVMCLMVILLIGCGGNDGTTPVPTTSPVFVNISGTVINSSAQPVTVPVTITTNTGVSLTTSNSKFNFQISPNNFYVISLFSQGYNGSLLGGFASTTDINNLQIPLSNQKPVVQYRKN